MIVRQSAVREVKLQNFNWCCLRFLCRPGVRVINLECTNNQGLLSAVFAGLPGGVGFLWPGDPALGALAAHVCRFSRHLLIVAGHGVLLARPPESHHLCSLCADCVRPLWHHLVIGGVALPLDPCLVLVLQLGAIKSELVGFLGDILVGCGKPFGVS